MSFSRFLSPALFAASFLCAGALHAADAPKQRTLGGGKGSGPLLTRDELRECFATQDRLKTKREETLKLKAQLEQEKQDITRRGEELKEQLVWLDRASQEQVDKYNAQAQERDKMIEAYQARAAGFNSQVDTLNAEREAFGRNCENRRFDEKDEIAIRNGK